MAEGFVNARYGDRFKAYSAGSAPTELHPCAIRIMAELGIDISHQRPKSVSVFDNMAFDCVVTMCADAAESCPIFPGGVNYLHHPFDNPGGLGNCAQFRRVRDQISEWIESTFGQPIKSSN
jgi:arsenate reductase